MQSPIRCSPSPKKPPPLPGKQPRKRRPPPCATSSSPASSKASKNLTARGAAPSSISRLLPDRAGNVPVVRSDGGVTDPDQEQRPPSETAPRSEAHAPLPQRRDRLRHRAH